MALLLLGCWGIEAQALLILEGGTQMVTQPSNSVLGAGATGYVRTSVSLLAPADLTFTYLGKEAAWSNHFIAAGDSGSGQFSTRNAALNDSFTVFQADSGLLDFSFIAQDGNRGTVSNGSALGGPKFLVHILSDTSMILGLDDGGANWDWDFDDLVVRIDAVARTVSVPEPGSLALLATGLAGVGLSRRRKAGSPAGRTA
jgi:hypothetical protein